MSNNETETTPSRIVGFYADWERTDITSHQVAKLTHAVFAYVQMKFDGSLGFKNDAARIRFSNLRDKVRRNEDSNVKMMISIGGFENSQHFYPVLSNVEMKKAFLNSISSFLAYHELHGVDIFWKWPSPEDKAHYSRFLADLRQHLGYEFIISVAVPQAEVSNLELGYDLRTISSHVDFFNVHSMDYYGPWPNEWGKPTGPISPLYGPTRHNVDWTLRYYAEKTGEPGKLNMVIPFFVRLWKNVPEPVEPGRQVFRDVELVDNKPQGEAYMSRWSAQHEELDLSPADWDEETRSSYTWNPDTRNFVTFETDKSIQEKMKYVKEKNLGGVWIWHVDANEKLLDSVRFDGEGVVDDQEYREIGLDISSLS